MMIAVEFAMNLTGGFVYALLFLKAFTMEYLPSMILFVPAWILYSKIKEYLNQKDNLRHGLLGVIFTQCKV